MSNQGYGPGEPQYPGGEPQYPHEQYGGGTENLGGYGPPNSGGGGNQRGLIFGLGAVVVAGLIVIVLAVSGVFSGSDTTTSQDGPKEVAQKLMQASVQQDLGAVKQVVCNADLDNPQLADIVGEEHATKFTVGSVDESADSATVDVDVTTAKDTYSTQLALVRENGAWKVCPSKGSGGDFSSSAGSGSSSGSTSSASDSPVTPSSSDTSTASTASCASSVDAASTARLFISYITLDQANDAATCVYDNQVSASELNALTGDEKVYSPTLPTGQLGPRFMVKSVTGNHTLSFTVEKQSDGKYYVTQASES